MRLDELLVFAKVGWQGLGLKVGSLPPGTRYAASTASFAHGWFGSERSSPQALCLPEKREERRLLSQECDDTSAHRWIDCFLTGTLCGTSTQCYAVTAPCVVFQTDKINRPHLWFARDFSVNRHFLWLWWHSLLGRICHKYIYLPAGLMWGDVILFYLGLIYSFCTTAGRTALPLLPLLTGGFLVSAVVHMQLASKTKKRFLCVHSELSHLFIALTSESVGEQKSLVPPDSGTSGHVVAFVPVTRTQPCFFLFF